MASSSNNFDFHNSSSSDDDFFDQYIDAQIDNLCDGIEEVIPTERKKRTYIERNREEGHEQLCKDYFNDNPTFTENLFRRRFRMNKPLFLRIVNRLAAEVSYFQPKKDATFRNGISPLQQCTAAIRQLAYGVAADSVDEYVRIGETTARKCLEHFVVAIVDLFGTEYLRRPTTEDLERLLFYGEKRGFPGMVGSIDCMHWKWKNCPTAWKGMYSRGTEKPTIVLEAVASQDLWIWHAFFGAPGTSNDLNVLAQSPVFNDIIYGRAPQMNYYVNGREYNLSYYLTDGIYPEWATFVKSIQRPQHPKHRLFAEHQEGARKDVKRAFGVLQSRFAMIKNPCRFLSKGKIAYIMRACLILHNMIVENERYSYTLYDKEEFEQDEIHTFSVEMPTNLEGLGDGHTRIRDRQAHHQLKEDLIENIWTTFGNE
ncbi:putative nuclease HARBI1 [Arabidopsis lyrata subsp. lyrata]|uniref:putative nuclease HARBI1 n=1 Tax=Arabidopsis lyrata subsp. lyrata TaxID=81972 RepID=UPI000A29B502|nr:putative nuclease HARBI1 [Arabidopsis lyrata subsp. lyrata]XP_020872055.1 putative nuclease HARBI1 [Arabidopsis lyrata subsp. lyrata]|eukprot:XP_020872053.1 putative nuclease HARBI1 [Arabidopsis lyrata subsp. lyrata]